MMQGHNRPPFAPTIPGTNLRSHDGDCKIFCVNPILTQGFTQEHLHERINRSFT